MKCIYLLFKSTKLFVCVDTDVWFYAVDPETGELVSSNDTLAEEKITGRQAQTSLKYIVTGDLHVQVRKYIKNYTFCVHLKQKLVFLRFSLQNNAVERNRYLRGKIFHTATLAVLSEIIWHIWKIQIQAREILIFASLKMNQINLKIWEYLLNLKIQFCLI